MELDVSARNLHLPVRNGADKVVLEILSEGDVVRQFDIELATAGEPDWWAFCDISAFAGKRIALRVQESEREVPAVTLPQCIRQSDGLIGADDIYRETCRPQFHFTSRRGWNNDPNGLVYSQGEHHLFYQHNPFGVNWGNMHWGHAVSTDLVHWTELPPALYPKGLHDMAFSGSGNVDTGNTAGFGSGQGDVLFLAFTSTGRGECIAYSTDGGRTFAEYDGNPVVTHQGRDPKVVWYEPQRKWIMIVYDESEPTWRYALYESTDLTSWSYMSAVEGFYECPDLFQMPLDGDSMDTRWIIHGAERRDEGGSCAIARSSYLVGTFDGYDFTPETAIVDGHLGPNFYAAQTFSNAPDGRRIMMGWLCGAAYPGMPFSQGLTMPLELSLRSTLSGPRLFFSPVEELRQLHREALCLEDITIEAANALLAERNRELLDLELDIDTAGADAELDVRGMPIRYHAAAGTIALGGKTAQAAAGAGRGLRLRVLVDRGVLEAFVNDGAAAFSAGGSIFSDPNGAIRLTAGAEARVKRLSIAEMNSIWPGDR